MTLNNQLIVDESQYVAPNYHPLPVVLSHGSGPWVWDVEGHRYLDMVSAYSAVSHGHNHPRLVQALTEQAGKLSVCSRAFYSDQLAVFAKKICTLTGFDRVLPMNTGAEAVETAIKAARRWGYQVKGIPDDKAEIIVADQNFHGRSTTIVGFSSESCYRHHFGPFSTGFTSVPFGDLNAIEAKITPNTCAILMEPMQGEAGIIMPPKGFMKGVKALAEKNNVLLIWDEIQTGLGRTGKTFAYEHEDAKPHGLILGKALGGGLLPISVFLSSKEVLDLMIPGSHGSTFGGNPLACRVASEALDILQEEKLAERSEKWGSYFKGLLTSLKHKAIKDVRGQGLWIGLDLDPQIIPARTLAVALMPKGVLCKDTHDTVVRFAPPLTIEKDQIDWAFSQVKECLEEH